MTSPPVGCAPCQVTVTACRSRRLSVVDTATVTVRESTWASAPLTQCVRVMVSVLLNAGAAPAGSAAPKLAAVAPARTTAVIAKARLSRLMNASGGG